MTREPLERRLGDPNELIGVTEAARMLGVDRGTVSNWLHGGRIPAIQYGIRGLYRVRRGNVIAYIEASRLSRAEDGTPGA